MIWIMMMIMINNNNNNRLTLGSPRIARILVPGFMLVTGSWLPIAEVLLYSHKEKSPAPCGPCGPIGPWEPLNPLGPIAPWDPLNPLSPVGPIGPWEPFTPVGPTGPGSLLIFSIWKENIFSKVYLPFTFFHHVPTLQTSSLKRWEPLLEEKKLLLRALLFATCVHYSVNSVSWKLQGDAVYFVLLW